MFLPLKETEKEEPVQIKVILNKKMTEKFLKIKESYGLKTNADTLRFCIAEKFKRDFPEP